jgi:hypothetical protein
MLVPHVALLAVPFVRVLVFERSPQDNEYAVLDKLEALTLGNAAISLLESTMRPCPSSICNALPEHLAISSLTFDIVRSSSGSSPNSEATHQFSLQEFNRKGRVAVVATLSSALQTKTGAPMRVGAVVDTIKTSRSCLRCESYEAFRYILSIQ